MGCDHYLDPEKGQEAEHRKITPGKWHAQVSSQSSYLAGNPFALGLTLVEKILCSRECLNGLSCCHFQLYDRRCF